MSNITKKILIVDDSALNRALLSDILEQDYEILEAENGKEAMSILHDHGMEISLMLLDIVMPEMDGFDVLAWMNKYGWLKTIRVIMISSESSGVYIDRAYDLGAIDYINRPFDERTVKHRVSSNYMLALKQNEVQDMLSNQIYQKERDNALMIEILSNIVEFRNGESGLHVLHVHAITERLLQVLVKKTDKYKLDYKDIRLIGQASALHDIGKISIPSEILNKPGRFTPEEFEVMKTHAAEGAKMLADIPGRGDEELVKVGYAICRWHHERYDGKGYPDGLKGDEIPISAQAVAIADVYDALTSKRVYKPPIPSPEAVDMIVNGKCGAFNPLLLECLVELAPTLNEELKVLSGGEMEENEINESVQELFKADGTDVTRRMVDLIEHERMKFKYLADISNEITFEYVAAPEMIKLSDWSAESLGLPASIVDPLKNESWCKIFPAEHFGELLQAIHATTPGHEVVTRQYVLNTGEGDRWNKVIARAMWSENEQDGRTLKGAICKIVDVNDTTETMRQLENRAECDSLTGLFNHGAAKRHVQQALSSNDSKYALLLFDIDNFKQANDVYGHLFGDEVIKTVADRMRKSTRSHDILARLGGDEFMVFMDYGDGNIEAFVKRIFEKLCGPCKKFYIHVSMGVACTEDGTIDFETLLNQADTAMYAVKKDSKNGYTFYKGGMSLSKMHTFTRNDHKEEEDA